MKRRIMAVMNDGFLQCKTFANEARGEIGKVELLPRTHDWGTFISNTREKAFYFRNLLPSASAAR